MTRNLDVPDEYAALYRVYEDAYEQASKGKGKERHASDGEAYEDQIICEVARRVGLGYPLGQAVKKIYESQRIGGERGAAELLGALNYVAAAVIVMREGMETAPKAEGGCFQNGNDHSPEEPEFKPGDKVEVHAMTARDLWELAVVVEAYGKEGFYRVEYPDGCRRLVTSSLVRPASRAEGCEALVEKDAPLCGERCEEFIPGLGICESCRHAREQDAPQTPQELCKRIIDANPATFHTPSYAEEQLEHHSRLQTHKPTGEELAEMAEEEGKDA